MPKAVVSKTINLTFETDHYTSHPGGINPQPLPGPPVVAVTGVTSATITVSLNIVINLIRRTPYLNGAPQTPIGGTATSYTFPNLLTNTTYSIAFTDTNVSGEGPPSTTLSVTTDNPPVVTPSAPTISVLSHDTTSITINSSGSTGATSYVPVQNGVALPEFTTFPYVFRSLTPNTSYTLKVRAKNSAGISADSSPVTQSTDAAVTALRPRLKMMNYGATDWTAADEIARRAQADVICLQCWYGQQASLISSHISQIRAANPNIVILAYLMCEGIGDPGSGALYDWINNNNFWARSSFPSGAKNSIWNGQSGANLAGTRTVGGFTAGEGIINRHFTDMASVYALVDGVMIDNFWIQPAYNYDYNEDGVSESRSSIAMRNAQTLGYQRIINRIKFFKPGFQIWCNPRTPVESLQGVDDSAAFKAFKFDGFMNQNSGPGVSWNGEGVFAYDGGISSFTNYRTYPAETVISGTPAHAAMLRNGFGGFKAHTSFPQTNVSLADVAAVLQNGAWITNTQNILQECKGFTETEEITYGAEAQRHNRVCLGYWWVLTDVTPYLYGIDTPGTGRSIVLSYQSYNWGNWIDGPGITAGPYATVNGHPIYVRRAQNGAMILSPRYENGQSAGSAAFCTIDTPTPPSGKTWTYWDSSAVGSTVNVPARDCVFLKAV